MYFNEKGVDEILANGHGTIGGSEEREDVWNEMVFTAVECVVVEVIR
jgi:hypothetical protein